MVCAARLGLLLLQWAPPSIAVVPLLVKYPHLRPAHVNESFAAEGRRLSHHQDGLTGPGSDLVCRNGGSPPCCKGDNAVCNKDNEADCEGLRVRSVATELDLSPSLHNVPPPPLF